MYDHVTKVLHNIKRTDTVYPLHSPQSYVSYDRVGATTEIADKDLDFATWR